MEYSIRNDRELMYMNGIGVWHEPFSKKMSHIVNYFSDRNMLIINQYAKNCNRWTLSVAILGRLIKKVCLKNIDGIKLLNLALYDMIKGFDKITDMSAEEKLIEVKKYEDNRKIFKIILSIMKKIIYCIFFYNGIKKNYINFRKNRLLNISFWEHYLKKNS